MADRFLRLADDTVVDIASARRVDWRRLEPLPPEDERRWADARGALLGLWHEGLRPLVDFGRLPDGSRYEAYGDGTEAAVEDDGSGALTFLRDNGLTDLERSGAVPIATSSGPFSVGIRLIRRSAVDRIAELLDRACAGRLIVVGYMGEKGSGVRTFLRATAREAVTRGFVPVHAGSIRRWPALVDAIAAFHVLLVAGRKDTEGDGPERILTRLALASSRGHVLLRPARGRSEDVRLHLQPFPADVLMRAVHVSRTDRRTRRAIAEAAARSEGRPGTFVSLLRGRPSTERHAALRVAEARPAYRIERPAVAPPPDVQRWIEVGEAAAAAGAVGHLAAAQRGLREAAAALRRRNQQVQAARLDILLGRLLLSRGAVDEAEPLFRQALTDLDEVHAAASADAAIGVGIALMLRGQLESSEAVLRAARAGRAGPIADLALARCLGWQGRYEDAERALGPALECPVAGVRGGALAVLGRLALNRHALPDAGRAASLALAEANAPQCAAGLRAAAHELFALVHGRIADHEAARSHAAQALAAARGARLPLRTIAVRLTQLEIAHAAGASPPARLIVRLERLARANLPSLIRARIDASLARLHPSAERRARLAERVAAFVGSTGARALAMDGAAAPGASVAEDVSALMTLLAREPDPRRLLESTAEWLRARLDATAVAVFDAERRAVASSGRSGGFSATERALVVRQAIPPYLSENGIEAAAPIEYAGDALGVVGVRWTIDARTPASAAAIIATGASCSGPALYALRDRLTVDIRDIPANGIVGRSPAILRLHDAIRRAAVCPFPVLIEGESGAGKELVARGLHTSGARRLRAFHAVNCAAFQDELFEAELFGHARGAFTGAHVDRPGLFEQADGGTLFLDEVSELSPRAQAKLLRVLQEGEIRRVGESAMRRVDVRVIAASNRSLDTDVKTGRFRHDLLFRIAVIRLAVPALRERREDIPLLAAHLWKDAAARTGSRATLTGGAAAALARYDWPGNVRELQNVIAALAVHVQRGRIEPRDVEALIGATPAADTGTLDEARARFERAHVAAALARCGGRQAQAARELGITRQGLAKLVKRLGIERR